MASSGSDHTIVRQALVELGKHGPDGLFVVIMFGLLLFGLTRHVDRLTSIIGLSVCCAFYLVLRLLAFRHAERMASLPVERETAKIASTKAAHRRQLGFTHPPLPLTQRRRRPTDK